jgi:hypothetical protein
MLADDFQYFIKQAPLRLDMRIFQLKHIPHQAENI